MQLNNILIVCIGNICRSPMAEVMLRHRIDPEYTVLSAGLQGLEGAPAHQYTIELMKEKGYDDIENHRGRQLNNDLASWADIIFTMSDKQKADLESQYPQAIGKSENLGKLLTIDIPDPNRRPYKFFRNTEFIITKSIESWIKELSLKERET